MGIQAKARGEARMARSSPTDADRMPQTPERLAPQVLKAIRADLGLSQSQLAATIGVNITTLKRYETGRRDVPVWLSLTLATLRLRKSGRERVARHAARKRAREGKEKPVQPYEDKML